MNAPTKTITTPFSKQTVVLKEWITGADREYIEGSFLSGIDAKPRVHGKDVSMDIQKIDVEKFTKSTKQRAIEKFVVSVDDVTTDVVAAVMNMHEDDTAYVLEIIDESSKKKAKESTA